MTLLHTWFTQATQHHQAARYAQAQALYNKIICRQPNHADAWHLRGLTKAELGDPQAGIADIQQAIKLKSDYPPYWINLGLLHQRLADWQAAMKAYHRVLQLNPKQIEACIYLGDCYLAIDQPNAAVPYYQQVLQQQPQLYRVWHNLGNAQMAKKAFALAIEAYNQAIQQNSHSIETISNKGVAYFEQGQYAQAIEQCQHALALNPRYAPAYNNLGLVYTRMREFIKAEAALQQAIRHQSDYAEAYNHLGNCYKDQDKVELAKAQFQQALKLKSNYPEAIFNLAITELVMGDFTNGWAHYEARHQLKEQRKNAYHLSQPFWQGESLANKILFILAEQGLGDTLQFIRFVPQLQRQAHPQQIIVECQPPLIPLLQPHYSSVLFVPRGQIPATFDVQTHLMSLPHWLNLTLETIPAAPGYLRWPLDNGKSSNLALPATLTEAPAGVKKIGLVWAGNPQHQNDHNRSIALVDLKPLLDTPNTRWYSLQWGERQQDIQLQELTDKLFNLASYIRDFTDTAGMLNQLDLVITVDTAMAHLAGALAKPVWVLLPFAPDFRWLLGRQDSPWYQSMKLYRQARPGDWRGVLQTVRQDLLAVNMSSHCAIQMTGAK